MTVAVAKETHLLPLDISTLNFTAEQFEQLCAANPERSLELTANGELIVMPPVGGESGKGKFKLGGQLFTWNEATELGEAFSSSTIFILPDGSLRSPDVAWVERSRWEALTKEERKKFPPLAPDFVIELRSETDRLPPLQSKMLEYRDNGVRLGWLINPQQQQVEIYRLGREVEVLQSPTTLSGEDILPGFVLNLAKIW
ncbi:MAG: Uma2 family endonuclease [Nostocaceae cyanobacterium]|nr:Uma2 family endonuclease [Nostocaceae cyanobacterium]